MGWLVILPLVKIINGLCCIKEFICVFFSFRQLCSLFVDVTQQLVELERKLLM